MVLSMFHDCMDDLESMRPSRLLGQHFGIGLTPNDLLRSPLVQPNEVTDSHYFRPWRVNSEDIGSTVHCDKEQFQVTLDVQHFTADEVKVKVADSSVIVEGKHEEKPDEHGHVSRHFVRRYFVPEEYRLDAVASSMSSDGVLTVSAPRVQVKIEEKVIPIKIKNTEERKAVKETDKEEQYFN